MSKQIKKSKDAISSTGSTSRLEEEENHLKIWQELNQTDIEILQSANARYPMRIPRANVKHFFEQVSSTKLISLTSWSKEDRSFLEQAGFSLTHLKSNQNLVLKNMRFEKHGAESAEEEHLLQQKSIIEEGYVYAICPTTGKHLKSNHSLCISKGDISDICYRFVGEEIFYLFFGQLHFQRQCLYFPRLDVVLYLRSLKTPYFQTKRTLYSIDFPLSLRYDMVSNCKKVSSYFLDCSVDRARTAIIGSVSTYHHLMNELSGIQKLYESGLLNKVDKFLVIDREYYGGIDELFPDIPSEKIHRLYLEADNKKGLARYQLHNTILEERLLALKLGHRMPNNGLIQRIYQLSEQKCSIPFLSRIKKAKQDGFPLLWVGLRTHKRLWISQIEGLANIVSALSQKFPDLGVIFDGYTRVDVKGKLLHHNREEDIIQQEIKTIKKIQNLFPQDTKVYTVSGCPMYEVVVWSNICDLYIIPVGSGEVKVRGVANKPGVIHGNTTLSTPFYLRPDSIPPVKIDNHQVVDITVEGLPMGQANYDFDWRIAYEELLKIASSIKRDK